MTKVIVVKLAHLEQEIAECAERIKRDFVTVGLHLGTIRDERLYRENHPTFDEYVRSRWGFTSGRARQFIAAAETVTVVTLLGLPEPATEREARKLVPTVGRLDRELLQAPKDLRCEYKAVRTGDSWGVLAMWENGMTEMAHFGYDEWLAKSLADEYNANEAAR